MPIFDHEFESKPPLDYYLLRDSSITLYHKADVLGQVLHWLKQQGYEIIGFDCNKWNTKEQFYEEFSAKLKFPEQYPATNLDSLNDWMSDIKFTGSGKVLALISFEHFLRSAEREALHLLDILEIHSREALLFGDRLITLLQTNDPRIAFSSGFGARPAMWNNKERMFSDRGVTDKDIRYYDLERYIDDLWGVL